MKYNQIQIVCVFRVKNVEDKSYLTKTVDGGEI